MPVTTRSKSRLDLLIAGIDQALRTLVDYAPQAGTRPSPTSPDLPELTPAVAKQSGRLMRVNHAGEVSAQALYLGQALVARSSRQQAVLLQAAAEEQDHLIWCRQRLNELGDSPSKLGALWFGGAYAIGMLAGLAGDRLSLGFLAETEQQVVAHLESHLKKLPEEDTVSRAIVTEMRIDEAKHASTAHREGATELPRVIKKLMKFEAKIMTTLATAI